MLQPGTITYGEFEEELNRDDVTKYIFRLKAIFKFKQIRNTATAEYINKHLNKEAFNEKIKDIANRELQYRYGDDVEFVSVYDLYFKRSGWISYIFQVNTPMTCNEVYDRFGNKELFPALDYIEVVNVIGGRLNSSINASKRIQDYVKQECMINATSLFEEDGFFTRDDCIEYLEQPLEEMIRKEERYHITPDSIIGLRSYIEDGNVIEVDCNVNDCEFTIKEKIDMRKIRKPSDLKKYAVKLFWKFDEEYSKCIEDIEGCDKITASKTLCVQHGNTVKRYKFARVDGQGDEYTGDEWFESYIVTPQGELLTWTLNGHYIPSAREFWIEDDSTPITSSNIVNTSNGDYEITPHGNGFTVQLDGDEVYFDTYDEAMNAIMNDVEQCINCSDDIDREFKAVPLKSLKKGAWFTIKPIAEPTDKQVYIKDDYDREEKKFMCGRCDDISYSTYFKGDKMVYDDSNFEY